MPQELFHPPGPFHLKPQDHVEEIIAAKSFRFDAPTKVPYVRKVSLHGMTVRYFPREGFFTPNFLPKFGGTASLTPGSPNIELDFQKGELEFGVPKEEGRYGKDDRFIWKLDAKSRELQEMTGFTENDLEYFSDRIENHAAEVVDPRPRDILIFHFVDSLNGERLSFSKKEAVDPKKLSSLVNQVLSPNIKKAFGYKTASWSTYLSPHPKIPNSYSLALVISSIAKE